MSFSDAYKLLLNGKKITRPGFQGWWFINPETGMLFIHLPNGKEISYGKLSLFAQNCAANDWKEYEEKDGKK